MKTSNLPSGQSILRRFLYGLLTCIIALLIRQALLTEEMRYTSNWTSILLLLILSSGAFIYFKQPNTSLTSIRQLFESSLIFGVAAGIAVGVFYYISLTILDPDYLQKTLDAAYKSWGRQRIFKRCYCRAGRANRHISESVEMVIGIKSVLLYTDHRSVFHCWLHDA
jgi:hypothetical protein